MLDDIKQVVGWFTVFFCLLFIHACNDKQKSSCQISVDYMFDSLGYFVSSGNDSIDSLELLYYKTVYSESWSDSLYTDNSVYLKFESGFDSTEVRIYLNTVLESKSVISTDNIIGLALERQIVIHEPTDSVGVKINDCDIVYVDFNDKYPFMRINKNAESIDVLCSNKCPLYE